jgi:hypothetical protein
VLIAAPKTNRNGYGKRESNPAVSAMIVGMNRNRSRMRRQRGQSRRRCGQSYQHSAVASAPAHHGALLHQRVEYPATRTRDRVRACVRARIQLQTRKQARSLSHANAHLHTPSRSVCSRSASAIAARCSAARSFAFFWWCSADRFISCEMRNAMENVAAADRSHQRSTGRRRSRGKLEGFFFGTLRLCDTVPLPPLYRLTDFAAFDHSVDITILADLQRAVEPRHLCLLFFGENPQLQRVELVRLRSIDSTAQLSTVAQTAERCVHA